LQANVKGILNIKFQQSVGVVDMKSLFYLLFEWCNQTFTNVLKPVITHLALSMESRKTPNTAIPN
jgi:hypothetical protein